MKNNKAALFAGLISFLALSTTFAQDTAIVDVGTYRDADNNTQLIYVIGWIDGVTKGSQFWTEILNELIRSIDTEVTTDTLDSNLMTDCLADLTSQDFQSLVNATLVLTKVSTDTSMSGVMMDTLLTYCEREE